jgi:TonB family protein
MKTKYLFLLLLLLIPFGCKEGNDIEVVTDYNQDYVQYKDLDKSPQLINGNSDALIHSIMTVYHKKYPVTDKVNEKPSLEYRFLVDEKGTVKKVIVGKNNDPEVNKLVLNSVKDWKFTPGEKNGKVVKFQDPMILSEFANLDVNEKDYFQSIDQMPEPIGGMMSIQQKIVYPDSAKNNGIEGKVFLTAYINEAGKVVSVKINKGIGGGCDEAAMQAVLQTKFIPGKQDGKPVKVQVTIPIVFKLH